MIEVEYNSGNSGGSFWLSKEDWKALEKAGWKLGLNGQMHEDESLSLEDRMIDIYDAYDGKKEWLGTIATNAKKKFNNIKEALEEFEHITNQDVSAEGCNCCGPPHSFSWEDEKGEGHYCSGEGCLPYLYPDKKIPGSIRETLRDGENE